MVATNWFILQHTGQASVRHRGGIDSTQGVAEFNMSDEGRVTWQVGSSNLQLLSASGVGEGGDFSFRYGVIEVACKVVAHGWVVPNFYDDLWFRFICPQEFEWNGFVEKICACGHWLALIVGDVGASQRSVCSTDDSHLGFGTVRANESDVEAQSVLYVWEFACVPNFKLIIGTRTCSEHCLLDPSLPLVHFYVCCCYGFRNQVIVLKRTCDTEFAAKRCRRQLNGVG